MNYLYPEQGHSCFLFPEEISLRKRKENIALNCNFYFDYCAKQLTLYVTLCVLYLDSSLSKCFLSTDINYFHCIRIVELLKVSESATKNIFGGYSSKRMKVCMSHIEYELKKLFLQSSEVTNTTLYGLQLWPVSHFGQVIACTEESCLFF